MIWDIVCWVAGLVDAVLVGYGCWLLLGRRYVR